MFKRLLTLPLDGKLSIFLFGPRGTGKTDWVKANIPDALYLDLLDFELYSSLQAQPNRLEGLIPEHFRGWVIIDEVQRIPELLNEVHRLIEGKKIRFLLTGSSGRSLKRKGTNLLAGRALTYHLHPLVIQEIEPQIPFQHIVNYGLLPLAVLEQFPENYLRGYLSTYVREEVLQEGLTRNIGSFSKFLESASFSQGALLNFSEIARETGIDRFVVSNYFDILEDLLIGVRIQVFGRRAKRRVVAHNKFYFFDTGVYRAIRPMGPLDTQEEIEGSALETILFQSLRAINDYYQKGYTLYFWRTVNDLEVDFVLYGKNGLIAFEIKRTKTITGSTLKGLRAFKEEYPEAKTYLLFNGKYKEYHDGIIAIHFLEALQTLPDLI